MLYKLGKSKDTFDSITPLPYTGLPLEKDLENLIAANLWDVLFEGNELMPVFQEEKGQAVADIYALNRQGDLIIFELKRDSTDCGAVHQVLRYCEEASHWVYGQLQTKFLTYKGKPDLELQEEHRAAFDLEHALDKSAFNQKQRLIIVGSAGDEALINNIDYWKSQGLSLDFIPYRIYEIAGDSYFEFYSLPYDRHANPANAKGVIFDTNLSYDDESIWYMCENSRVAAFGDAKQVLHYIGKNDVVFLYNKNEGIVAAGRVLTSTPLVDDSAPDGALYHRLEWLTATPQKGLPIQNSMPASKIKDVLGKNFFWASTIKKPYLTPDESDVLIKALITVVGPKA